MTTTTRLIPALAIAVASVAARADELDLQRRSYDYGPRYLRYEPQARQGLLVSVGLGGGSLYLSDQGPGRIGAADFDFRLGYGVSDQLQLFMDFNADEGTSYSQGSVGSWTWTMRAQTVLIGDRAGNGLNLNLGVGFGGLTYDSQRGPSSSPTGLALGGGLSYDARVMRNLSFSPEFFYTWHQVPNGPAYPDDVSSIYGLRINLLWYLH